MRAVWSVIRVIFRGASYLALVILVAAFGAISFMLSNGLCSRIDTGAVLCAGETAREAATLALSIVLVAMVTGVPALLAFAGFLYLLRDLWRGFRRFRRT